MKKTFKTVVVYSLVLLTFFAFVYALGLGIDRQEVVTCNKLQLQASTYDAFYLTKSEKEMCDYHNIKISAPVEYHK